MDTLTTQFLDGLQLVNHRIQASSHQHLIKRSLLDYLGVTIAGSRILKSQASSLLQDFAAGAPAAQVIGFDTRASLESAVLVNGLSSHVAELDDGLRYGSVHPGAPIFSALLPLAEQCGFKAEQFFHGVSVGYEAAGRLAMAIQPSHRNLGYHATGTCGTVGVAMGIGAALAFTPEQMRNTLAAAVASASGMLKMLEGGSMLKAYNVAQAASSGLMAARMAQAGFQGPRDVLDGARGFLAMTSESLNAAQLKASEPHEKSVLELIYVKPYAACRHCHSAIEAALNLKQQHGLDIDQIQQIAVQTYRLAGPGHDHTEVDGITSAKMSTPYSIAVALLDGRAGIAQFEAGRIEDPEVHQLAARVNVSVSDDLDRLVPDKRAAEVEISLHNGDVVKSRVDLPKGEPETALSDRELEDKFADLAKYGGKSPAAITRLVDSVWDMDSDLSLLLKQL